MIKNGRKSKRRLRNGSAIDRGIKRRQKRIGVEEISGRGKWSAAFMILVVRSLYQIANMLSGYIQQLLTILKLTN